MKMTIYLPEDLAAEVKDELGDANISAICQGALRDELARVKVRLMLAGMGAEFARIEAYDPVKEHWVAFQGRQITSRSLGAGRAEETAYVTPKGSIVVCDNMGAGSVRVFADFGEFEAAHPDPELTAGVAEALGERYTEELDI